MKHNILVKTLLIAAVCSLSQLTFSCCGKPEAKPARAKYVFYFIGDGMGLAQAAMAEAYLATQDSVIGNKGLDFTSFPVTGFATTYSANSYITCSAAAGTALATGHKTKNNMISELPDSSSIRSIAYKIKDNGYKVGIATSVTINHATPAVFYASADGRQENLKIAYQLPTSGFDFFAAGGIMDADKDPALLDSISAAGYRIMYWDELTEGWDDGFAKVEALKDSSKVLLLQGRDRLTEPLPYAIDRIEGDLTLSGITENAIRFLNNEKGFFTMIEGGKIDWACHDNDVKTCIKEVIDLDWAIQEAIEFYRQHPDETLIVVTADHETGGLSLGNSDYTLKLKELDPQDKSIRNYTTRDSVDGWTRLAKCGWTTFKHTGIPVPVYALGAGSELFSGRMDNTDIPKRILKAMCIE